MPATEEGLWAGSDTDHAGGEYHQKIAFFPTAGGVTPPPVVTYSLPNDLYNMNLATGSLDRRSYDLTTFGTTSSVPTGVDWRNARGAFMVSGRLYTGWSDATFRVQDFDGTTMGAPATIGLNGLEVQPPSGFNIPGTTTRVPAFTTDLQSMTGMFYSNGRIYYTVSRPGTTTTNIANNNKLYYRYFTPESQVVGANLFVASSYPADTTIQWANVAGMTMANGKLIYATTDNRLWRVDWSGTAPTGTPTQIGGPGIDAANWASRGLFVFNQTVDTFAPTTPGAPSGSSSTFDSIDLTWQASVDNISPTLTYQVYRDGIQIGQVISASKGAVTYTDAGLPAGSTHTYRVDAVDGANNSSPLSNVSSPITVLAPDTTPPSDPGLPAGVSTSTSTISLTWAISVDNESTNLTYRIYRDGVDPGNFIAQFQSSSDGTVSFVDTGLWPGTAHTYSVQALDEAGNESNKVTSDSISVMAAVFADNFTGGLAGWSTVTRISLDVANGSFSAPSAQGTPTAQSAYAYADLPTTLTTICVSANVNVTNRTTSLDLIRLRTAANGAVAKVYLNSQGQLVVRSDFAGTQQSSSVTLSTDWNRIELCGSDVASSGLWDLYLNGSTIVSGWAADTGTEAVGRIQIGDTAAKTWTANWDDVVVDQASG